MAAKLPPLGMWFHNFDAQISLVKTIKTFSTIVTLLPNSTIVCAAPVAPLWSMLPYLKNRCTPRASPAMHLLLALPFPVQWVVYDRCTKKLCFLCKRNHAFCLPPAMWMAMMTLISHPVLGHIYIIIASLRLGQSLVDSVKSDGLRLSDLPWSSTQLTLKRAGSTTELQSRVLAGLAAQVGSIATCSISASWSQRLGLQSGGMQPAWTLDSVLLCPKCWT